MERLRRRVIKLFIRGLNTGFRAPVQRRTVSPAT
jgi:hypothetical protein